MNRKMRERYVSILISFILNSRSNLEPSRTRRHLQTKSFVSATEEELKMSVSKLTTFYFEASESEVLRNDKTDKEPENSRD